MLPAFLALLNVSVENLAWQALDPSQRHERMLKAIKHLLLWESQIQPLLLVFHDLHWIDAATQALLDSLVESLPTAQILLLVSYRPEYQHSRGNKTYYTQLQLEPLPPAGANELLQTLLGNDATLEGFRQFLIKRTEGNPFFLEECVRTMVETQVLAGQRGAYRLVQPFPTIQVPLTVQALLAARINCLSIENKQLLAGDLQAALAAGEGALTIFEAHGNIWWACRTLWHLSTITNALGSSFQDFRLLC